MSLYEYSNSLPDYEPTMYLRGFSVEQIFQAFRNTQRKKKKDSDQKKREQSILEKEMFRFIENSL